jgi:hypothetical protein
VDPALQAVTIAFVPGAVLLLPAIILLSRAAMRQHRPPSVWGLRLFYLGLGLFMLLPGIAVILSALLGWLQLPALVGGLVPVYLGASILYGLRRWWADPSHGFIRG